MNYEELVKKLDDLCWSARRWGHDDDGLDFGIDLDGNPGAEDGYHPEAVALAETLAAEFGIQS